MPVVINQADTDYSNSGTISDGVTIAASGVGFTNTDSGRIYTGVTFTSGGSTLINQLGGVISLTELDGTMETLVTGSSGADTIENEGLIKGRVELGGGADVFIDRDGAMQGLDLGSGNDTYRVEGSQSRFLAAAAGDGQDLLVLAGTGQYWAGELTGFEKLRFETGGNFSGFSGFQTITLAPLADPLAFINLIDCLNPFVDLTMSGQRLMLHNSTLQSITGGSGSDSVEIGFGTIVTNGIALGDGDDGLLVNSGLSVGSPELPEIDGGAGTDTLSLQWYSGGERSYDLSGVQGFEKVTLNFWQISDPSAAQISNIAGLTDIDVGLGVTLTLTNVFSPDARVGGALAGGLIIEAGSLIDRYGFPETGSWDNDINKAQGDPAYSTDLINRGVIEGDVRFYIGDDLYDGREGSAGGIIYGNAGNDVILGGAGAETMNGGYGADTLDGGGGADTMIGGRGNDIFKVDSAGDAVVENSDEGTDTVFSSIAYALGANVENLTLTGAGSIMGVGNDLKNVITGNSGANVIHGGGGADTLIGGAGNDTYYVDDIGDQVIEDAASGSDAVYSWVSFSLGDNVENLRLTGLGDSFAIGNGRNNLLVGNSGSNVLDGRGGADRMGGGAGNDTYYVDNAGDQVGEKANEGSDTVFSSITYALEGNVEALRLIGSAAVNATGNDLNNVIAGNSGANTLFGGGGNDKLYGGKGTDQLWGGTGADEFAFGTGQFGGFSAGTAERIHDFSHAEGDRIGLDQLDANTLTSGNQAFTFIGNQSFHGVAGELRAIQSISFTYVYGDTNGDGVADFLVVLDGAHSLTSGDFLL